MKANHEQRCAEMRQRSRRKWRKPRCAVAAHSPALAVKPLIHTKTIQLESGGTLTLLAEVGVFKLSQRDWDFMFSIADRMRDYEENRPVLVNWQEVVAWHYITDIHTLPPS